MAQVELLVGGRHYRVACQDGGEAHLIRLAGEIDRKIADLSRSMGGMDEPRRLLFAALLLADENGEVRAARDAAASALDAERRARSLADDESAELRAIVQEAADEMTAMRAALDRTAPSAPVDAETLRTLEGLADRIEALADERETE